MKQSLILNFEEKIPHSHDSRASLASITNLKLLHNPYITEKFIINSIWKV